MSELIDYRKAFDVTHRLCFGNSNVGFDIKYVQLVNDI